MQLPLLLLSPLLLLCLLLLFYKSQPCLLLLCLFLLYPLLQLLSDLLLLWLLRWLVLNLGCLQGLLLLRCSAAWPLGVQQRPAHAVRQWELLAHQRLQTLVDLQGGTRAACTENNRRAWF